MVRAVLPMILSTLLLLPHSAGAAGGRGYIDAGGGYKTGDFGGPSRTELYYLAATIGYMDPAWQFSVTAPVLFLSESSGAQTGSMHGPTGIGDVVLRGGAVLLPEKDSGLSIRGSLAVKLPTADEQEGLGTGERDYGGFFALHQRIGSYTASLLGGYIKVGDPAGVDYNDTWLYGIGLSRAFGWTEVYASFEGRRSTVKGADDPLEIGLGFFHAFTSDVAVRMGVFAGLNDGGPAFGLDLGLVRWF